LCHDWSENIFLFTSEFINNSLAAAFSDVSKDMNKETNLTQNRYFGLVRPSCLSSRPEKALNYLIDTNQSCRKLNIDYF